MQTKQIAHTALLSAAALSMYALENALPPLFAFAPGVRLGLSNAVCLLAIFLLGWDGAYLVFLVKSVLGALLAGNPGALLYALPAGLLSLTVQILLVKFLLNRLSLCGISVIGAFVFNAVQLLVARLVTGVPLLAVLPLYLLSGAAAGLFTGLVVYFILRYLPRSVYLNSLKKPIKNKNMRTCANEKEES
ncbi:MAG: Gx transporter family protein [Clostridiales bacterium]|jgi:heptaprenyl diphosphate synthase|nr:Gx transporter family protein [Clostridiales bacterium]